MWRDLVFEKRKGIRVSILGDGAAGKTIVIVCDDKDSPLQPLKVSQGNCFGTNNPTVRNDFPLEIDKRNVFPFNVDKCGEVMISMDEVIKEFAMEAKMSLTRPHVHLELPSSNNGMKVRNMFDLSNIRKEPLSASFYYSKPSYTFVRETLEETLNSQYYEDAIEVDYSQPFTRRDVIEEKERRCARQKDYRRECKKSASRAPVKYAERKCVGRQNYNFKK